jgi:hypothetical protein
MSDTPTGTVPYSEFEAELGPEATAQARAMAAAIIPRVEFMRGLREASGLTKKEFIDWILKDDFAGLPPELPRRSLSIAKLMDLLDEKKGSLTLNLTLDGISTQISYP